MRYGSSRFALAAAIAALIGCGSDDDGVAAAPTAVEQLEAVGIGQYFGREVPQPTSEGEWLRYEFAPSEDGPVCLFGTPYLVFVRPGVNDKVQFYLEGGGACWNEETCFGASGLGAKQTADPLAPLNLFGGVLGSGAGNPMDGWNVVYVPYCDGSVFSGDNVIEYDGGTVYHRGQANISAALDVMRDNFPDPSEIVVSGSSAGGYGTFTGYGIMRVAYPDKPVLILNDSGPGLQNNDDPQAVTQRRENWRFHEYVVDGCTRCDEQVAFLIDWALANDPDTRVALFSYQRDFVIADFLALARPAYRDLLLDVSTEIAARNPDRFKRFLVDGQSHTILLGAGIGPGFEVGVDGTFDSTQIDGTSLQAWIGDFLIDGPQWRDLVEPPAIFVASGEDTILTFPEIVEDDHGTVEFVIVPKWNGLDLAESAIVGIGDDRDTRSRLIKEGNNLRFIVTDNTGYEAELTLRLDSWEPGQSHRIVATWGDGPTKLEVDGHVVANVASGGQAGE